MAKVLLFCLAEIHEKVNQNVWSHLDKHDQLFQLAPLHSSQYRFMFSCGHDNLAGCVKIESLISKPSYFHVVIDLVFGRPQGLSLNF